MRTNHTTFDNTQAFIGLLDFNGTLLNANQPSNNFIGATIGHYFWETQNWANNQQLVTQFKQALHKGVQGVFSQFEIEYSDVDGNRTYLEFSLLPIYDKHDKTASLIAEFRYLTRPQATQLAVTERKNKKSDNSNHSPTNTNARNAPSTQREQHLSFAMSMAGLGTWEWDMESDQVLWDAKQFELFGVPWVDGPIPLSTATDAIHPDDRGRLAEVAKEVKVGDRSALEEFRVIHPDGTIHWLLGGSSVICTNQPDSSAILIGINMDVTKSKNTETALRQSQSQLQIINETLETCINKRTTELEAEAQRHKETLAELADTHRLDSIGQLAGGVAHDFNNLLAVIGGNLELAALQASHLETSKLIAEARIAVDAGTNITQRLLSFAQKQHLSPVRLSTTQCVMDCVRLLERTLGENVPIEVKKKRNIWDTYVVPGKIHSAVINLAVNAWDAMPKGGKLTITLSNFTLKLGDKQLLVDAQPGDYVGIFVSDTGVGMTSEVIQKALDPFYTTKEINKGTGLGLSSVYGFVKESEGFLKIDSELGTGTSVRLYLPRAPERMDVETTAVTAQRSSSINNKRILVVEDESMVRKVTVSRLKHLGYDILEAATAQEAIDTLTTGKSINLVFSDIVMPGGMTGYELADWVFKNKKAIPVLLTSGYFDPDKHRGDTPAQPQPFVLIKPYTIELLEQKVHAAMEQFQKQKQKQKQSNRTDVT